MPSRLCHHRLSKLVTAIDTIGLTLSFSKCAAYTLLVPLPHLP
jgi:hypothetical protein